MLLILLLWLSRCVCRSLLTRLLLRRGVITLDACSLPNLFSPTGAAAEAARRPAGRTRKVWLWRL